MSYSANPRAHSDGQEVREGSGVVTSDSLAAESLRRGGDFAEQRATYSGQGAPSSADIRGSSTLPPASDRQERLTETDVEGKNYRTPAQEPGMNKFADKRYAVPGQGTEHGGAAPSYVQGGRGEMSDGTFQPKGRGLQEGGFDAGAPNASFGAEIGSRQDPGRVAEQRFENRNAHSGNDAGYEASYSGGKGGFENLDEERA